MIEFLARRAALPGTKSVYFPRPWGAVVVFSDALDLAQTLEELTKLSTEVANGHWVPPQKMVGPIRTLVYLDPAVASPADWQVHGSDLHYRVRPDLDIDSAVTAVMAAISDAANHGWRRADDRRAVG